MTSSSTPTVPSRARLDKFFERVDPARARIILAIDATASRQPTWDTAAHLQAQMFDTVAAIGGIDVQLVYYRGYGECVASGWKSDATSLASVMARVMCESGHTQIRKVLTHTHKENAREKVNALILISDACEEAAHDLHAEARELNVPLFIFQEGADEYAGKVYAGRPTDRRRPRQVRRRRGTAPGGFAAKRRRLRRRRHQSFGGAEDGSREALADASEGAMTDQEEADRLVDQITATLRRDPRFPHLNCLENELLFRDLQRELEEVFERIFEAGYYAGKFQTELEAEEEEIDANHQR
jgi:hypothetical protein